MMKLIIRLLYLTFLFVVTVCVSSRTWAGDPNENEAVRAKEHAAFLNLVKKSRDQIDKAYQTKKDGMKTKGLGLSKSLDVDDDIQLGVSVWFELADGTYVNPLKNKLRPKERFYIHVVAAFPIYLSLFQVDPDAKETKLIYPTEKYRNNRKVLQAEEEIRFPVVFALNDDYKDEILSLVVVRADWFAINDEITNPAVESLEERDGKKVVTSQLTDAANVVIKSLNDKIFFDKDLSSEELQRQIPGMSEERAEEITAVVSEDADYAKSTPTIPEKEEAKNPNAVKFYMLQSVPIGQCTLKISKDN